MAALSFQPFIDKENATIANPQTGKARGLGVRGHGEKVFTSGTPSLTTPRRALGDVQNTIVTGSSIKSTAQKGVKVPDLKPCNPFSGVFGPKAQHLGLSKLSYGGVSKKKSVDLTKKVTVSQPAVKKSLPTKKTEVFDNEIEQMFIYKEPEDDFEDIIPKSKRINSYILDKMISWRLPCMTGSLSDEEEDEETEERRRKEEARREEEELMAKVKEECERLEREAEEKKMLAEELELAPISDFDIELPHIDLSLLEVSP